MEITNVLPPTITGEIDLDMVDCFVSGPDVSMEEDEELTISNKNNSNPTMVVELVGFDSRLTLFTDCERPHIVIHFKAMKRFLTISVLCLDDTGKERVFEMSNKNSVVTIENGFCKMPMEVENDGWQYTCIEVDELLANAFNSSVQSVREITITGTCRISKVFFQSKKYADCELPPHLRVVNASN